jgi:hypothetical protein
MQMSDDPVRAETIALPSASPRLCANKMEKRDPRFRGGDECVGGKERRGLHFHPLSVCPEPVEGLPFDRLRAIGVGGLS